MERRGIKRKTNLDQERMLEKIDTAKRDSVKKVVLGTVFAVPVINSLSMEGLNVNLTESMDRPGDTGESGKSGDKPPVGMTS